MTIEPANAHAIDFASCYARWSAEELVLGNAHIERRWRIERGLLFATSFYDHRRGYEWLAQAGASAPTPGELIDEPRQVVVNAQTGPGNAVEAPSLRVEMTAVGERQTLRYRLQIFPDAAAVTMQLAVDGGRTAGMPEEAAAADAPTGIEGLTPQAAERRQTDLQECLSLSPLHLRLTQVILHDQTDVHNELAQEVSWLLHPSERQLALQGNLFFVEDTFTAAGLIFLKHAPLPHARPVPCTLDLTVQGARQVTLVGHGMGDGCTEGYAWTVLAYSGGAAGRTAALHGLQRQIRPYVDGRDGLFLSNTWGDRSRDSRIEEGFLRQEVAVGERLGVDVIQIDDGWQQGRTSNSAQAGGVWEGFWAADPQFWAHHPARFPRGLSPIIAEARRHGLRFGLWFAPDSAQDFANWQRDAETILQLHRTLGVAYVKIDGVKARTKRGEANLHRFFNTVLEESHGRVVFDLDVTAEIRPGYFGLMHVGPLFIENRYTDWRSYWPHQTLRNLWVLAHYIDPLRLRMEFLNNTRHPEQYPDDPLAPAAYRPDYLFAITLLANPLGWFEMSQLPEAYVARVAPLAHVRRAHRARLFASTILPIGDAPDGTVWTGFCACHPDGGGYILLFRELTAQAQWSAPLPGFPEANYDCTVLAGEGNAQVAWGRVTAEIPGALGYVLIQVTPQ